MTTQQAVCTEAPITAVQPGGGTVFGLELAWGRLRRALLRRLFPGHVRRFLELRQGECPNCPHDVIDPRDLKPYRNTCGHWFRPEDDPYAWRGRLGLARDGLAEIVCFSLLLLPLVGLSIALGALLSLWYLLPLAALVPVWLFLIAFFRDPPRTIPTEADLLVSPADGVVTHVEEVAEPDFPGGRALRVSIFLSVFNVHVNRIPRAGRVTRVRYFPGEYLDARHQQCHARNEQLWLDLDDPALGCTLRVKQIAGAIARRIVCAARVGEELAAGQRYGMIKFGSRTDVLLPPQVVAEAAVKVGQVVYGGRTVLLRVRVDSRASVS
jgi:phosphatidylserine decarboxylase